MKTCSNPQRERVMMTFLVMLAMLLPALVLRAQDAAAQKAATRVAVLTYADGKTSKCFAAGFLDTVARHTRIEVAREFSPVTLGQDNLHGHPFTVMTGEGAFTLSSEEKQAMKSYLERGGFLLASAGCSSQEWIDSFRTMMTDLFPGEPLQTLAMDHGVFRTIYTIDKLAGRKADTNGHLEGVMLGDRLAVVFSPMGLNDTENAGGGCCCCGGNELREAHRINANILAYVLTH